RGSRGGYLVLETVAQREQLLLVDDVLAAILEMVFEDMRLHDRIDRAAFLAEPAIDALEEVDVVTRRAARAVLALVRVDGDRERRAYRLGRLARDAAFLAFRVTAQRMQAAEPMRTRNLLFRIAHRVLGPEQVLERQPQAGEQLEQEQA